MTGRRAPSSASGVHTLSTRQSSPGAGGGAPDRHAQRPHLVGHLGDEHRLRAGVAVRGAVEVVGPRARGCGGRKRFAPPVGAPYGMPRNTSMPSSTLPRTRPLLVSTTGAGAIGWTVTEWPPGGQRPHRCSDAAAATPGTRRLHAAPLHVERRVEGLDADGLDLAQHVAFVDRAPGRVDEAQRLAVVAPVRRVEPVGLLEVRRRRRAGSRPGAGAARARSARRRARTPVDAAGIAR